MGLPTLTTQAPTPHSGSHPRAPLIWEVSPEFTHCQVTWQARPLLLTDNQSHHPSPLFQFYGHTHVAPWTGCPRIFHLCCGNFVLGIFLPFSCTAPTGTPGFSLTFSVPSADPKYLPTIFLVLWRPVFAYQASCPMHPQPRPSWSHPRMSAGRPAGLCIDSCSTKTSKSPSSLSRFPPSA